MAKDSRSSHAQQLLGHYEAKKQLYDAFAVVVKQLLEDFLQLHGYRNQPVTCRSKSEDSLRQKLQKFRFRDLADIRDLAGCRVIFYLESDIPKFVNLLYKEFRIIKDDLKYSPEGHNARNVVVELTDERLRLSEYSQFRGLRCEIQLTTVLFHAWSEMAHDIIYKPEQSLLEFDKVSFEALKKQFASVMKEHIMQASYKFELINKKAQSLRLGRKIFDPEFLRQVTESISLNEMYEHLQLLLRYVREYGDKTPEDWNIIKIIRKVIEVSKTLKPRPVTTLFGRLKGQTHAGIVEACLEIIDVLRYYHTQEIIPLVIELSHHSEPGVRQKALRVFGDLCQYNLDILKKVGYRFQLWVLDEMEKSDRGQLAKNFQAVVEIAKQLLKPSFEGHRMKDYNTLEWSSGALLVSDTLKEVRRRVIELAKRAYLATKGVVQRRELLRALAGVSHAPVQGKYGDEMIRMLCDDVNRLVDFYLEIVPKSENLIIKEIEEQVHTFRRILPSEDLQNIDQLVSLIRSVPDYEVFRVLVGYDYKYGSELDWERAHKQRIQKVDEFVKEVTPENFELWRNRITSIAEGWQTFHGEGFESFGRFLYELGKRKPSLGLQLASENARELGPHLVQLLIGLWNSTLRKKAKALMTAWANRGRYLAISAEVLWFIKPPDGQLLRLLAQKSFRTRNADALNSLIRAIARNYSRGRKTKKIFLKILELLNRLRNFSWINQMWPSDFKLVNSLNGKEVDHFLNCVRSLPNIDFHVEYCLVPIAKKYPLKVVEMLHQRVQFQVEKRAKAIMQYDALPYDFHELGKTLREHKVKIIPAILRWFEDDKGLRYWHASRLLSIIFPEFDVELERALIEFMKKGNEREAKVVLSVLRAYSGQMFLHNACKEFIKRYNTQERYMTEMCIVLSQTGVVGGEYGFVNAFKSKKEQIQAWKKDPNGAVRKFANDYEQYLDVRILEETKRADEQIQLDRIGFDFDTESP